MTTRSVARGKVCYLFAALVFVIATMIVPPRSVSAMSSASELLQEVLESDCSEPDICDMSAPKVTRIEYNGNKPIITGTFDAVFTKELRVIFGDRVYILGVDEQLMVNGNIWTLDLSSLDEPLVPGAYQIVVEAEDNGGNILRIELTIILTPISRPDRPNPLVPDQPTPTEPTSPYVPEYPSDDNIPTPMTPEEVRRRISLRPLVITVSSSVTLFSLFLLIARKRRRDDEDEL